MFIYCLQILEGIATVIIGFLTACVLPESLENASFFTEDERVFAGDYFIIRVSIELLNSFLSTVNRFRLDDSRISNASPETGTKDDNDVNADFLIYTEEEIFEWKEITRGWIITPFYNL